MLIGKQKAREEWSKNNFPSLKNLTTKILIKERLQAKKKEYEHILLNMLRSGNDDYKE